MRQLKVETHSGERMDLMYDRKNEGLDITLGAFKAGGFSTPIIVFSSVVGDKETEAFRVHIKEALKIKRIIDELVIDYLENLSERSG